MNSFTIRPVSPADKSWIRQFIAEQWCDESVAVHDTVYFPHELPGFIAIMDEMPAGLVTYTIVDGECEMVTLDSVHPGLGIGSALIEAVKKEALQCGCSRMWLITTNDNINALLFYQKRGFVLAKLYPDAVTRARKLKPSIPLYGIESIPIRDEIELEMRLRKKNSINLRKFKCNKN
jgi:GNAT superfamily N-acetyltransferase